MNDEQISMRLYIVGSAPISEQAVINLNEICNRFPDGRCNIEIIDVLVDPNRALEDGAIITPMLFVHSVTPELKFIGDLSRPETVLKALGVPLSHGG